MRYAALLLALLATAAGAQPGVHPANRALLRIGLGAGYGGGATLTVPSLSADYPCYDAHYRCGGYVAGYQLDGAFDYEVLSTHTLYVRPASTTDPYLSGFAGFGYGEAYGLAWGIEAGVNVWVWEPFGFNAFLGYVEAASVAYTKAGVGLVLSLYAE